MKDKNYLISTAQEIHFFIYLNKGKKTVINYAD